MQAYNQPLTYNTETNRKKTYNVDTSTGGLLVPEGIIHPVVKTYAYQN
jgi:hypothetical protein